MRKPAIGEIFNNNKWMPVFNYKDIVEYFSYTHKNILVKPIEIKNLSELRNFSLNELEGKYIFLHSSSWYEEIEVFQVYQIQNVNINNERIAINIEPIEKYFLKK